jgi:hypothetical protein
MTQPMIRAFTVHRQLEFIEDYFDAADRERVKAEIPSEIMEDLGRLKKVDWCPAEYCCAMLRAISSAKHDPKGSYNDIVECGKFVSVEATNTFYKLLLKVITPSIFLKKMDTFWAKDFKNAGRWNVTIDESKRSATLILSDAKELDHIAPFSAGFITFVITAMGINDVSCETQGWTLETPGADEVRYHVRWA